MTRGTLRADDGATWGVRMRPQDTVKSTLAGIGFDTNGVAEIVNVAGESMFRMGTPSSDHRIQALSDHFLLETDTDSKTIRINSRNYTAVTGDNIGFQSKPAASVSKTSGNIIGCEISPRVNSGVALASGGSIIGAHIDTYLRGTAAGTIAGDVRVAQLEAVTDDAGTRTISGNVSMLRFRAAFSATAITGTFVPIRIEKPEVQTNSQNFDAVFELTSTLAGVWNDAPGTEPTTADGYIKVLVNGNARYIQLYSGAPVD